MNYEEVRKFFDPIPVAFTIIEIILNEKNDPEDFVFRYANSSFAELEEVPLEKVIGRSFYQDIFTDRNDRKWLQYYYDSAFCDAVHELHDYSPEIGKYLKIISYPWLESGCCACILFDETELVKARERLEFLANYDEATLFKNRNAFEELSRNFAEKLNVGVVFVDVNCLKETNDKFGHMTGDILIGLVSEKINHIFCGAQDQVFRFGGDEFVIILQEIDRESLKTKVEKLREELASHNVGHFPPVLASVGWSWEKSPDSLEAMIEKSDIKMYEEKRRLAAVSDSDHDSPGTDTENCHNF